MNNGWYSQQDIAHLVAFANERGIRLIPEFDMHVPEFGQDFPLEELSSIGVYNSLLLS